MKVNDEVKWFNISQFFLNNKNALQHISYQERNDIMQSACIILENEYSNKLKSDYITLLYKIAFLDDISLEECWQIYWIITNKLFSNSEIRLLDGSLRILYSHIYNFIKLLLELNYRYQPLDQRNQDCIIIIVNQFLSTYHSPTIRTLDYSYAIKKYLNKNILIINSSELNYYRAPHLEPSIHFNFATEHSDFTTISYKDEQFDFYQVSTIMPNIEVYRWLLQNIYEINPLLIYNIGGSNILTDLCTNFTATVSLPCSYDIPISCSKYLAVGRTIDYNDQSTLANLLDYQHIIETKMNFNTKEDDTIYTRNDFNLDNSTFIISIVGNRLDLEIDEIFLNVLNKIIDKNEIHIIFIGSVENKERILSNISEENLNKISFLGQQAHAMSIIKISNLYLNPKRKGGGRSSFEALSVGVPVVTLDFGDVYHACGKIFSVDNYDNMYTKIMEYYSNPQFYNYMSKKGITQSQKLSNIHDTQQTLINNILQNEK